MEAKTDNSKGRTIVGLSLTLFVVCCLYYGYIKILFVAITTAVFYDIQYMLRTLKINIYLVAAIYFLMQRFNIYLVNLYYQNPQIVIIIGTVTQVSDVYQYLAGKYFGKNKIGWISKNKSYEGYIIVLLLTVITFLPFLLWSGLLSKQNSQALFLPCLLRKNDGSFVEQEQLFAQIWHTTLKIILIYSLGVISGLISSFVKRLLNIKDYSDLLGPHGGWMDRIDSIVLPILVNFLFF